MTFLSTIGNFNQSWILSQLHSHNILTNHEREENFPANHKHHLNSNHISKSTTNRHTISLYSVIFYIKYLNHLPNILQ